MVWMVIQDAQASFTVFEIQHHFEPLENSEYNTDFLDIEIDNNILIKKNFLMNFGHSEPSKLR